MVRNVFLPFNFRLPRGQHLSRRHIVCNEFAVKVREAAGGNGSAVPNAAAVSKGDRHLRSIAEVSGYGIHAIDGDIGHLDRFLIDDDDWTVRYLVVDTATWWLGKHVLVAPSAIKEINWAERFLRLDLTCYKIKGSPVWEQSGIVDRAYEKLLRIYYGLDGAGEPAAPGTAEPEKLHA